MSTVTEFATLLSLHRLIHRAWSFHPDKLEGLWRLPCDYGDLKTSAGRFNTQPTPHIKLHHALKVSPRKDLVETFLHELAHAVQWELYREVNHGESWWEAMHQLGQKPSRLHSIAAVSRPVGKPRSNPEDMGL